MSQPSQQLTDDHASLDQLLKQLQAALQASDVETSHTRLDLFWARLAVHIRAEHLQLFPVVLDCMIHTSDAQTFLPALNEALSAVDDLREDHDFFMHELARAMAIIRTLSLEDQATIEREMNTVRSMMVELEKRLVAHNQLEEDKVYAWITTILNDQEQTELADRLRIELANRPPRFSPNEWTT